jgi:predicted nucleic acid-binding protein
MVKQKILVDTNILIDHFRLSKKIKKESQLEKLLKSKNLSSYIAATTTQELFAGQSSKNKKETSNIKKLLGLFKIISIDSKIAQLAGEIIRDTKKTILVADAQIAASAINKKAKLFTKNKKVFSSIKGIKFYNLS